MKRCPVCATVYSDADQFCELDGTLLPTGSSDDDSVAAPVAERKASEVFREMSHQSETSHKTLAIIAIGGIAVGVLLFFAYRGITGENANTGPSQSTANVAVAQRSPTLSLAPLPVMEPSPSVAPSPSPSLQPSPSKPAASASAALSSSQISTSGDKNPKRGAVTIRLTDGTSVEADEAWETGEGIWYRRRGIVTLLNRTQVRAIEKAGTPTPTAEPQPSPSQTPPS